MPAAQQVRPDVITERMRSVLGRFAEGRTDDDPVTGRVPTEEE
jgi:hypothetical protein